MTDCKLPRELDDAKCVDHVCPECNLRSSTPFPGVVAEAIHVWRCRHCDSVFGVQVHVLPLEKCVVPKASFARRECHPVNKNGEQHANRQQRLLELCGQRLLLLDLLQELGEKIARLEEDVH